MPYSIVIPARYHSSRLPAKPLADIHGKPMIQHVYERAKTSAASEVIVATDDERIQQVVRDFGGEVLLTSDQHPSGTDRLHEVAVKNGYNDEHIIVNLQGDEPMVAVAAIEQVAANLEAHTDCAIATLCELIKDHEDLIDPNIVKVVRNKNDRALYFSRATIPFARSHSDELAQKNSEAVLNALDAGWCRHIGMYAYRVKVLHQFVSWSTAKLEEVEALEQLRAMYHGITIHCAEACTAMPSGVDTPEDLRRVREQFKTSI